MLETPRMKIVKMNDEHIGHVGISPHSIQELYSEFLKKMESAFEKAEEEIIREFAESEDLSLKCARYFINKSFKFEPEVIYPDGPMGTPSFALTLVPKSPEELLYDFDTLPMTDELNECERELLEKHRDDKWEWIK